MCGIAGITWPDRDLVGAMAARVAHRGPDQSGLFVDDSVSLGHRRLSIIDLSERGRQPMRTPDGSVTVVFNGEIYNFQEIRRDLESQGYAFRSGSDTEVILYAYQRWGVDCVARFNGIFAFAIWDTPAQQLFLARDRLGVKPLYYSVLDGADHNLVFGSEIKALLECPLVDRSIDPQAIYQFIGFEFVPSPRTIFHHVQRLAPGHRLIWRRGRPPRVERYWRLQVRSVDRSPRDHARMLRDALQESVRRQLIADVPLGVFLSGGLDSSAIVAMMRRIGVEPLDTFSLHYEDASFSELDYANFVAKRFDTRHHVIKIDPITPDLIETCCWHLDEPMTDLSAMPFYLLCKKVREHVTVCLSGEGGDELLCGYDRFKASRIDRFYRLLPGGVRRGVFDRLVMKLADRPQKKGLVNSLKRFVEGDLLPPDGRHMRWQYFCTPEMQQHLFSADLRAHIELDPFAPVRHLLEGADCEDSIAEEIYVDTCMTMPDSLLMKADKMSMAHGLEVRVPLLDHEFAELCCTIPSRLKLQGLTTKAVFRKAMDGVLPDHIRGRGKQGYSLPIKQWLRGELREVLVDTLESSPLIRDSFNMDYIRRLIGEHLRYQANHNHVLWALLNLAVWHRIFGVGRPAPPVK
jgi:asparagine synthase (glutamine-hydrolysing)